MPRPSALPLAAEGSDSALLSTILAEVLALRADVAALRPAGGWPPADEPALAALLHAIAMASGGRKFTVAELLEHADVVRGAAEDQRLHDAIVGAVGAINGRRLGKPRRRLEGRALDGLRAERLRADREGITWRVAGLRV